MTFDVKKAFRRAAAIALFGILGAGAGGLAYQSTHGRFDDHHTPDSIAATRTYETRLTTLGERQHELATSNDETAAAKLETAKRGFYADVLLDSTLSEGAVKQLATSFNRLSGDDGIRIHSIAENPKSAAERNECLNDILLTNNRYETAQRVDDCMISYTTKDTQGTGAAREVGALVGIALAGSFLLGGALGRRKSADAPKAS